MSATITTLNGTVLHLWQLPELSAKEPEESIRFEELENDLGDGYSSQVLYGANTGLRRWNLQLNTLAHTTVLPTTVEDVNGAFVSREQYVWNLFMHCKTTGDPFVYVSPRDGQYYLVRFVNKELSYKKARIKLYSTGIELKQVRLRGESVFRATLLPEVVAQYDETGHNSPNWEETLGTNGNYPDATSTGDVIFSTATQNGLYVVRLNSVASTGFLSINPPLALTVPFNDLFMVIKMREGTFSNNAGVLTGDGGNAILVGTNGDTKFQNPGLTGFEYTLNGTPYEQSNMQAPMDTWGVIHLRSTAGINFEDIWQIGKNQGTAGTFAKMDVAQVIFGTNSTNTPMPTPDANQIVEALSVKWGIS